MPILPQSPLSPVDILSRGLTLGTVSFGRLLLVTTALAVLSFLPTMDLALHLGNRMMTPESVLQERLSGHQLLIQVISLLLVLGVQALALARLGHIASGVAAEYSSEIRRGMRAYPAMLGALLLSLLIGALALALSAAVGALAGFLGRLLLGKAAFAILLVLSVVVMAFYVFVYLVLVQYCIVLEGEGPIRAINRSFNLVYGHWWRVFLVLLLATLCIVLITMALGIALAPLFVLNASQETGRSLFVMGVFQMAGTALAMPFFLAILYMLYHDLTLRSRLVA